MKKMKKLLSKTLRNYIQSLFENIKREIPENIDLVLDGGAFNGGYMLGALYYLKEMEKKSLLKIERISSCSIGSILGFLYLTDCLDYAEYAYDELVSHFRSYQNLSCASKLIEELVSLVLNKKFKGDEQSLLNCLKERFYISFFDIHEKGQIQKKTYDSIHELILFLKRTTYLPFIVNGNMIDQNGCMDGFYPFIFRERKKKILCIKLITWKKFIKSFNIKHEANVYSRVWTGIDDINRFFMSDGKISTDMCSYVNNWPLFYHGIEHAKEFLFILVITFMVFLQYTEKYVPNIIKNNLLFVKSASILKSFYNEFIVSCVW